MDEINSKIRLRDYGEPILVVAALVAVDYLGLVENFQFFSADWTLSRIGIRAITMTIVLIFLRPHIFKYACALWGKVTPIKNDNIFETILLKALTYVVMISAFGLIVFSQPVDQIARNAFWIFLLAIPGSIFGAILSNVIKDYIKATKSAAYSMKR